MEANKIQDADILDIIFEGRNKDYGAYELRKTYNNRIVKSLVVMGSVVGLLVIGNVVSGFGEKASVAMPDITDFTLENLKEPKAPVLPPPPVIKAPPPQVAMKQFTPPLIVKTDVPKNEKPPSRVVHHMSNMPMTAPSRVPKRDTSGLALRTSPSSLAIHEL